MANPVPMFEDLDEAAEERALQEGLADADAGRVVPHEEVVRWLQSWGKPGELPKPSSPEG